MIINKKIELACEGCGAKFMYNEDNAPTAVPDHPETWHGERVDETECIRRHNARQAELDSRRAEMKDKMERLAKTHNPCRTVVEMAPRPLTEVRQ